MQRQVAFGTRYTLSRCHIHFLIAPERSQNSNQHEQGLIVVRLEVCGTLEMPRRLLKAPLSKASPSVEVMGFKQIRIERNRPVEFCHRLRVTF